MPQPPQSPTRGQRFPWLNASATRHPHRRAIALTLLSSLSLSTGLPNPALAQISAPTLDPETHRRVYGDEPVQASPSSQPEVAFCPTLQDFYFRREQAAEQRSEADEALFRALQVKRRKHIQFERRIKLTRNRIKQLKRSQRQDNDGGLVAQIRDLEALLAQLKKQQAAVGFDEKRYAQLQGQSEGSYEIFAGLIHCMN